MKTRNTNGKRKTENGKRKAQSAPFTFPLSLFTLTLFSVLCTLYSCDSEDDFVAPSIDSSRIVTVQLNAESKPRFGESTDNRAQRTETRASQSTDNRVQSTAGDGGANLCTLYSELCTLNPELCTLSTRSAGGTWVEGDEVIAYIMLSIDNGYLNSYSTLRRTAEGNWQVVEDKFFTIDGSTYTYYDYHLLAEETLTDLNAITVKIPEGETATNVIVQLIYAPEMEVAIETDAGGAITCAEIITRATALTTYPEQWFCRSTDTNGWYTDQARIRIHTGKEGDVVKYGNSDTATATTNSDGDAYFYLTEITSDITITRNDVTVTLVPAGTTITAGQAYWHDASWSAEEGLQVVKASDIDASYTIPAEAKTLYVTGNELATNGATSGVSTYLGAALKNNTTVKAVILPEVTEIPELAFYNCTNLATVTLPEATTIGQYAFIGCEALKEVSLPKATSIGFHTFASCEALTTVNLPEATTIESNAFINCTALATVTLPEATTIQNDAFFNCTALATVTLPEATTIGQYAFASTALTSMTFGSVVTSIDNHPFYDVNTENCTLTLAAGQKESATLAPSGNTWAGYTWKEIKFTE